MADPSDVNYIPNAKSAVVAAAKITRYLLNESHREGASKARFLMRFGFDRTRPVELATALLLHCQNNPVIGTRITIDGEFYEIDGPLSCPDGRLPVVRTVWIIDAGFDTPRLVTLVPREIS